MTDMSAVDSILKQIDDRDAHLPKYKQAAEEILGSLRDEIEGDESGLSARTFLALLEPDRQVAFRVTWEDDAGQIRHTRAFRVQQSGLLGPYKGGLRFAAGLSLDPLRFLALEQTFKNALTGLGLGAGKGGADIDPRALSRAELRRFCVAFIRGLAREIGPHIDVPAGDIGVGGREIGWMFGELRSMTRAWDGTLTGKPLSSGGVRMRTEATGYGLVYFLRSMLEAQGTSVASQRVLVSGSGNVALHAAEKVVQLGGTVLTLSSRRGTAIATKGLTKEQLSSFKSARADGMRLAPWCESNGISFEEGVKPWTCKLEASVALPCAVENELDKPDVVAMTNHGLRFVAEGANMPSTNEAINALHEAGVHYAPGKASNAGGVAVSGLEMRQNASRNPLSSEAVDRELGGIMARIHDEMQSVVASTGVELSDAANIVAFRTLKQAAVDQGLVV